MLYNWVAPNMMNNKDSQLKVVIIFSVTNKIPISETTIKILEIFLSLSLAVRLFNGVKRKTSLWARLEDRARPFFACSYQEFLFLFLCTRVPSRNAWHLWIWKDYKDEFKCSSKRDDLELKLFDRPSFIVSFSFQITHCRPLDLKELREWNMLMNCKYKYFNHSDKYSRIFQSGGFKRDPTTVTKRNESVHKFADDWCLFRNAPCNNTHMNRQIQQSWFPVKQC